MAQQPASAGDGELGMSATMDDTQDHGAVANGAAIGDEDVHALLAKEREHRQRAEAERDAERSNRSRAEAAASTHATARFDAEDQAITARLESAEAAALGLRKEYATALAEGQFDQAAEIQDKMAELRAKQVQDRAHKAWLASEKDRIRAQPAQSEGVDLSLFTDEQRAWIRKNPEFMVNERMRARTMAGHQLAVADGIAVDSPEYFEVINEMVARGRVARRQPVEDEDEPVQQPRRREPPNDMPVTRRMPQQAERRQREVKLSADEMEAADVTLPDIPVQGRHDKDGNLVSGRYERYVIQRNKLRERGN
jgi:hypothetical protein